MKSDILEYIHEIQEIMSTFNQDDLKILMDIYTILTAYREEKAKRL